MVQGASHGPSQAPPIRGVVSRQVLPAPSAARPTISPNAASSSVTSNAAPAALSKGPCTPLAKATKPLPDKLCPPPPHASDLNSSRPPNSLKPAIPGSPKPGVPDSSDGLSNGVKPDASDAGNEKRRAAKSVACTFPRPAPVPGPAKGVPSSLASGPEASASKKTSSNVPSGKSPSQNGNSSTAKLGCTSLQAKPTAASPAAADAVLEPVHEATVVPMQLSLPCTNSPPSSFGKRALPSLVVSAHQPPSRKAKLGHSPCDALSGAIHEPAAGSPAFVTNASREVPALPSKVGNSAIGTPASELTDQSGFDGLLLNRMPKHAGFLPVGFLSRASWNELTCKQ